MSSAHDATIMTRSPSIPGLSPTTADGKRKGKKRVRVFTSEDRASHRVIEKQRREALNQRFLELARLLPSLAHTRRLSKSIIVNESISYLKTERAIRLAAAVEVRKLLADYDSLLTQLNNRNHAQIPRDIPHLSPRPVSEALLNLLGVEKEEFGTFPGGFSDGGPGDEAEDDHAGESDCFGAQRDDDFTNVSDEPPNFLISDTSTLMNAMAPAQDFTAMQLPLDLLATDTTYVTDAQQHTILDPPDHSNIYNAPISGDMNALNEGLPGSLHSGSGWAMDMYPQPAFHHDSNSAQMLSSNGLISSQFHGQHPPIVENTGYWFLP